MRTQSQEQKVRIIVDRSLRIFKESIIQVVGVSKYYFSKNKKNRFWPPRSSGTFLPSNLKPIYFPISCLM